MDLEFASAAEMAGELERRGLDGVLAVLDPSDGGRGHVACIGSASGAAGMAHLAAEHADRHLRGCFLDSSVSDAEPDEG